MKSPQATVLAVLSFALLLSGCTAVDRAISACSFYAMGNEPHERNRFNTAACIGGVRLLESNALSMGFTQAAVDAALADCNRRTRAQGRVECTMGVNALRDRAMEEAGAGAPPSSYTPGGSRTDEPAPRPGRRS